MSQRQTKHYRLHLQRTPQTEILFSCSEPTSPYSLIPIAA